MNSSSYPRHVRMYNPLTSLFEYALLLSSMTFQIVPFTRIEGVYDQLLSEEDRMDEKKTKPFEYVYRDVPDWDHPLKEIHVTTRTQRMTECLVPKELCFSNFPSTV